MVITGSHNWSSSAETVNDENTVIVHDARIANLYYQEFYGMLTDLGVGVEEHNDMGILLVYPNPVTDVMTLVRTDNNNMVGTATIYDMNGRVIMTQNLSATTSRFDVSNLPTGVYMLEVAGNTAVSQTKFIRQ